MKRRANLLLIPAVALGLGACKKEEAAKAPETAPAAVVEKAAPNDVPVPPAEAPKAPAVTAEERAAKLGFAKYLPQDTEIVLAFYNGSKTAERVKSSKLWKYIQTEIGMGEFGMAEDIEMNADEEGEAPEGEVAEPMDAEEQAVSPEDEEKPLAGAAVGAAGGAVEEDAADAPEEDLPEGSPGPAILFGSEFTFAFGKSTGEQLGLFLNGSRRASYYQMRDLAKAAADAAKSGDTDALMTAVIDANATSWKQALQDPAVNPEIIDKLKGVPIYAGFRVSEADRPGAAQQIASMIETFGMFAGEEGIIEPVKLEQAGGTFEGLKIVGAKVAEQAREDREDMDEFLGAETTDRVFARMEKLDLVVVSGTIGDHIVIYVGPSEDFRLEAAPARSIAGGEALAFTDPYLSKELGAVIYTQKDLAVNLVKTAGGLADLTNGLRDGLAASDGLGDTRDLQSLLQIVGEREAALRKLAGYDSTGIIAFFEDGLKIESYGGVDYGMADWKTPNKMATLGDSDDVLLFANMTSEAAYDEAMHNYLESLVETAYALTVKVSELPLEGDEMAQFKSSVQIFDTKFRTDMLALWDAFGNEFSGSLGNESAFVIDMKGAAPAIPNVPQEIVDNAKIPRITFLRPVTDRSKLSGSWDKMNTSLTSLLGKVSEMTGAEIPMQKPLSSEKNDYITWFFPMPFFTDDFLPSVTVGDKWFAASTSKVQALDLINKAESAKETRTGAFFNMNFRTLEKYADETFKLLTENAKDPDGGAFRPADQEKVKKAIAILSDLDKLTVHSRREGGVLRSTIHFKTR